MSSMLIVDDDADGRDLLARALRQAGYQIRSAPNGRDALASILSHAPDLLILDLFMPEMDGGGLLEILRSYLRLQSLPVIVLTGLPDSPMVERARHLKVNAILVKTKATTQDILHAVEQELKRVPN